MKLKDCFAMLVTLLRLEERYGEQNAWAYSKALSSVAADDESTQILTAAENLELDGDGKEWRRYTIAPI